MNASGDWRDIRSSRYPLKRDQRQTIRNAEAKPARPPALRTHYRTIQPPKGGFVLVQRKDAMPHNATVVTYTGDNSKQLYALVLQGNPREAGELTLNVWHGVDGWQEHGNVPHGSATQGDTWH